MCGLISCCEVLPLHGPTNGGKPATHNTGKCTKYEKDGTVKPSWSSGKYLTNKRKEKSEGKSHAQLEKRLFAKVDKAIKRSQKASASRKKKRHYDSDSSSDSE